MFLQQKPLDGGMLYTETNLKQVFPEPLNALTAFIFLLIAVYWSFKIRKKYKAHLFLSFCILLLYIGGIGGSIYHAFRKWHVFILMDWLPIMILCVAAGIYFMLQLMRWYYVVLVMAMYIVLRYLLRWFITLEDHQLFININYATMAGLVFFSVLSYLIYTRWKNVKWVIAAVCAFVAALTFRIADSWDWLSSGTHFLWHILGAVACFCMFSYIYLTENTQLEP